MASAWSTRAARLIPNLNVLESLNTNALQRARSISHAVKDEVALRLKEGVERELGIPESRPRLRSSSMDRSILAGTQRGTLRGHQWLCGAAAGRLPATRCGQDEIVAYGRG